MPPIWVKLPITISRVWSGESARARVPPSDLSLVGPARGRVKSGSIAPVTGFSPARNMLPWPAMFWKLPPTYSAVPSALTAMSLMYESGFGLKVGSIAPVLTDSLARLLRVRPPMVLNSPPTKMDWPSPLPLIEWTLSPSGPGLKPRSRAPVARSYAARWLRPTTP